MIYIKKSRNPHEKSPPSFRPATWTKISAPNLTHRPLNLSSPYLSLAISALFDRESQFPGSDGKWRTLISAPDQANQNRNLRHVQTLMPMTSPQKLTKYPFPLLCSLGRDIDGSTRVRMRLKRMHKVQWVELHWR